MKTCVGVFFGGKSVEHEVSILTAMQAIAAMDQEKYQVIPVYVSKKNDFYIGEGLDRVESYRDLNGLTARATQVDLIREENQVRLLRRTRRRFGSNTVGTLDAALLVFHGTAGEDGVMQGLFERLELPYTGCDLFASAAGMDKWTMKALFQAAQVPHLPGQRIGRNEYYRDTELLCSRLEQTVGYPLMIKPYNLGSSVGIGRAADRQGLETAMDTAFEYARYVICEQAVTPLREINCSVLGDEEEAVASVCEEPIQRGELLSYADKYQGGGKGSKGGSKGGGSAKGMESLARQVPADIPAELTQRIQALAVEAFHAVGASGVSRVDFLLNGDTMEVWVNEINTIPGSLAFYLWEASGLPFSALIDRLIALALKRQREQARTLFSFDSNLLASANLSQLRK